MANRGRYLGGALPDRPAGGDETREGVNVRRKLIAALIAAMLVSGASMASADVSAECEVTDPNPTVQHDADVQRSGGKTKVTAEADADPGATEPECDVDQDVAP